MTQVSNRRRNRVKITRRSTPKAARAYRDQIERGLDDNPREAAKARFILRDLLGPIQMCPGQDGSLWAQYHTRPAALIKRAVGASVELSGSGGLLPTLSSIGCGTRCRDLKSLGIHSKPNLVHSREVRGFLRLPEIIVVLHGKPAFRRAPKSL